MSGLTMDSPMSIGSPMSRSSPVGEKGLKDDDQLAMALEAMQEQEQELYENHTVSTVRFGSILLEDLSNELRAKFFSKMIDLIPSIIDFMVDFQTVVFLTMSLFRSHMIVQDKDKFRSQINQGFQTQSIFPPHFIMNDQVQYSANPLPSIEQHTFNLEMKNLFTSGHLEMMVSEYYAARGTTA
jgi:hypothetical protein